jgi:formylglycine-generating enzyme required for sulfatase activity
LVPVFVVLLACRGDATVIETEHPAPVRPSPAEGPSWIAIAGGGFTAGSPSGERCREDDEVQRAAVVAPFESARTETTRGEFLALMGSDPSFSPDCPEPACPVVSVTWQEAVEFCRRLSPDRAGRLPSELEWELAARAGTSSALPSGEVEHGMSRDPTSDKIAWTKASSGGSSHPVATRAPNAWGLYDMAGNAAEWVADRYRPDADAPVERVVRGGDWYHNAEHARSAARERLDPAARMSWVGFRCARGATP